jgi:hypothetical protein
MRLCRSQCLERAPTQPGIAPVGHWRGALLGAFPVAPGRTRRASFPATGSPDRHGFQAFAAEAAPQLLRWESPYGWTRSEYGKISEKEMTLAAVVSGMLTIPDNWTTFAGYYLDGPRPRHQRRQQKPDMADG